MSQIVLIVICIFLYAFAKSGKLFWEVREIGRKTNKWDETIFTENNGTVISVSSLLSNLGVELLGLALMVLTLILAVFAPPEKSSLVIGLLYAGGILGGLVFIWRSYMRCGDIYIYLIRKNTPKRKVQDLATE